MYCKRCGAPLPENGVCLICQTDHSGRSAANVQAKPSEDRTSFCKYCGKHLATNEVCGCWKKSAKRGGQKRGSETANATKTINRGKIVGIFLFAAMLLTATVLLALDAVSALIEPESLTQCTTDAQIPAQKTSGSAENGGIDGSLADGTEGIKEREENDQEEAGNLDKSNEKEMGQNSVTEQPRTLSSISVRHMPDKQTYFVGQELDLLGLTLTATYDSGEQETIESGFDATFDSSKAGTQMVTVQYMEKTTDFQVVVVEPEVSSIELVQYPTAELRAGDQLDMSKVVIRAKYNNGSVVDGIQSGFSCEPTVFQSAGTKTVTVEYQGKSTSFSVSVMAVPTYTIRLCASNSSYGTVSGGGIYEQGQNITIRASANSGCRFLMWNDGVVETARTICVERDMDLVAVFYGPVSETWVEEAKLPAGALVVEEQEQYRYRELQTMTTDMPSLSGWTYTGSTHSWSEWSSTQQTTTKPTESDELRIVGTTVKRYAYYHYCNRYSDGTTGVDSCDVDGSGRRHTIYSSSLLPSMYINADHGARESEARGGYGNAEGCSWNYYAWWPDPANDAYTYDYQTRSKITTYTISRYTDWSTWSLQEPRWSSTREIETRTVYRYRPQ